MEKTFSIYFGERAIAYKGTETEFQQYIEALRIAQQNDKWYQLGFPDGRSFLVNPRNISYIEIA